MPNPVLKSIRDALGALNPDEIRKHTERRLRLLLYAHSDYDYLSMEEFLIPPELSPARRSESNALIRRASEGLAPLSNDEVEIYFEDAPPDGLTPIRDVFAFHPDHPERIVDDMLRRRPDLAIPLARNFLPFRAEVSSRIIKKISRENALFALATAVPDLVPFVSLPWAVGEFASDTAVLTANQIRMAFRLAAAHDRDFGYREQSGEIASLIAGAFGWRALARELVGKIPMGGGLIPKGAIAYAGTFVVGLSLERYYRLGYAYTKEERRFAYQEALARGRDWVASWLGGRHRAGRLPRAAIQD